MHTRVAALTHYRAQLWSDLTGALVAELGNGPVRCLAWSANSELLLMATVDHKLTTWTAVGGGRLVHTLLLPHRDDITHLDWAPNGRMAASGSKDRSIRSWVPVGAF